MMSDEEPTKARQEPTGRALNAAYQPVQDIEAWTACQVPEQELQKQRSKLEDTWTRVPTTVYEGVIKRLIREAAAETGAVEALYDLEPGQTRTIALEAPGWEAVLTEKRQGAPANFEAQVAAYAYVRQLAQDQRPITETCIRELHKIACANQDTYTAHVQGPDDRLIQTKLKLNHGEYKEHPNHVRLRSGAYVAYSPVSDTTSEMHRLTQQLRSKALDDAHPVIQARPTHIIR